MGLGLSSLTSFFKKDIKQGPTKAGVVGIDIGSSAIKIVQLHSVKGIPTLETYGELQLGPYEGVDLGRSTHLPPDKLKEALIDILRESGATGKEAAYAFSYNSSFISMISIPTIDPKLIGTMVSVEARKYIPISLTKVSLDWFPLSVHEEEKKTDVLISAVYNEALARYETTMRESDLGVVASEIEIFSSVRSTLVPKDDVVVILDCGASSTRMYILRKGIIGKTHSVLLSGVGLTNALEASHKIGFSVAEELKRNVGLHGTEEDPRTQKTLVSALERGLRELHTVTTRYEEEEGVTIDKIILSGSGALLHGLKTYTEDMFSRPVVLADPFSKVAYPAFLEDTLTLAGPSFAVAIGVALRAFESAE